MLAIGTDEKVIIEVLSSHTNTQLQTVKSAYKTLYGRVNMISFFVIENSIIRQSTK